jgi:hypothetical protein
MNQEPMPAKVRLTDGLGATAAARKWIVCWDDQMGACWPMGKDAGCEGALCALHNGKIVMFSSRADARKAIKVSTAYAKLRKAQGLPANEDFLGDIVNVRIVECESA